MGNSGAEKTRGMLRNRLHLTRQQKREGLHGVGSGLWPVRILTNQAAGIPYSSEPSFTPPKVQQHILYGFDISIRRWGAACWQDSPGGK